MLLLILLAMPSALAVAVVVPERVEPNEAYALTVLGQPGEIGTLSIADGIRPEADVNFTTDEFGRWIYRAKAPNRETTLSLLVIMNASGSWSGIVVVAAPSCTTANAPTCLGFLRAEFFEIVLEIALILAVVLIIINTPNIALAISRYERESRLRGGPTTKELLRSPVSLGWTVLPPAAQTPAVLPNDRIAIDLRRRERLLELKRLADYARKFDGERVAALIRKVKEIVDLYELERSVLKRPKRET